MHLAKRMIGYLRDLRTERACKTKLRKIRSRMRLTSIVDGQVRKEFVRLWRPIEKRPNADYLSVYAAVSGLESPLYVPEDTYYKTIEPTLNNRAYALAYADKNFYQLLFPDESLPIPKVYLRGISGTVYTSGYESISRLDDYCRELPIGRPLVIKPAADTSGGRSVSILELSEDGSVTVDDQSIAVGDLPSLLLDEYRGNFVIQDKVKQHSWFARFNDSSVNSVRMMTYKSPRDEAVHVLGAVLRFGREFSIVDNQAAGGFSCGIRLDGTINDFRIDKYGQRRQLSERILSDREVPLHGEMCSLASRLAARFPYHRLLGFDFCVNAEKNLRLLEVNTKNLEINFFQMSLGPLFGEFTEEIVEYCGNNEKSVVLDFSL